MENWLLRIAGITGALVTIAGAWVYFGLPTPALSMDIQRLEERQLDVAEEVYQQKLDSLIILNTKIKTAEDITERERGILNSEIKETEKLLDDIRDRKIQLAK